MLCSYALLALTAHAGDTHTGADHKQLNDVRFDIHGDLDGYGMFGVGGRVEFAIVPDGLIRGGVHDELALSFGADVMFAGAYLGWGAYDGGTYVVPVGAVQWNFYLGHRWSVFPELGIAVHVGFERNDWHDDHGRSYGWVYPQPHLGIGARFHFSSGVAMLFRVSTPAGLQLGVVF